MDADQTLAWYRFIRGKWVREMPNRPGEYPVASRDGLLAGSKIVYLDPQTDTCKAADSGSWQGWWWSVPLPKLPTPGKW